MTEKTLESFNDVFADIVNVLLFKNKRLIKEDELTAEARAPATRRTASSMNKNAMSQSIGVEAPSG